MIFEWTWYFGLAFGIAYKWETLFVQFGPVQLAVEKR